MSRHRPHGRRAQSPELRDLCLGGAGQARTRIPLNHSARNVRLRPSTQWLLPPAVRTGRLSRSRERQVSQPPALSPEPEIQHSGSQNHSRRHLSLNQAKASLRARPPSVGAVLLPINCGNGNGLAIEAHLVIIALSTSSLHVVLAASTYLSKTTAYTQRTGSWGCCCALTALGRPAPSTTRASRLHQPARICALVDLFSKAMRVFCHSRFPTAFFFGSRTVHSDLVGLCRHWADMLECHKPSTAVVAPEAGLGLVIVGAPLSLSFLSMSLPRPVHNNTPTRVQQPYDVGPHRKQGIQGSPPPSHCTLHACLRRLEYGISNYPCLLMTSFACATIFLSGKLPLISSTLRR